MKKPENNNTNRSEKETIKITSFSIKRVSMLSNGHVSFDMELNGIIIYGCFVVEGKDGDFISLPQRKGNDGKYYSIVFARFSSDDSNTILKEVERMLNEKQ